MCGRLGLEGILADSNNQRISILIFSFIPHNIHTILTCGFTDLPIDDCKHEKEHEKGCTDKIPRSEHNMMHITLHIIMDSIDSAWRAYNYSQAESRHVTTGNEAEDVLKLSSIHPADSNLSPSLLNIIK